MILRRICLLLTIWLAGCKDQPPAPSFLPLFPLLSGELLSRSSPALADLNRDGVDDIVFGAGVERLQPGATQYVLPTDSSVTGFVVAVSAVDNKLLWKVRHPRDAFTMPRFLDVNGDGTPDVIMGGREGGLAAYSGRDGQQLWRARPESVARTNFPYNFFTPAIIADQNGDGMQDLLVVYGGDDTRLPNTPRDPGFLVIVSGRDGAVLHAQHTPDGKESYASVVVYRRPDGQDWFVFGTGGETDGGAAYRAPVSSLRDGSFPRRVQMIIPPGSRKGVMAPASLFEVNNDADPEIAITTFDGRIVVVEGATGQPLWWHQHEGEEAYHQPAIARIARDGRPGLLVSFGVGAFPKYTGTVHRLYDAQGKQLMEYRDAQNPGGAPLAVDLTGDGIDEPIFFSDRFPNGAGGRVYILHGPSSQLLRHDLPMHLASTPLIADPRGTGKLELISLGWHMTHQPDPITRQQTKWDLLRLALDAPVPEVMAWPGYMGRKGNGEGFTQRRGAQQKGAEATNR